MERKRNKLQVIYDILKVINDKNGKIKPTHILYKSNLSYIMMKDYLSELIEKGLIKEQSFNGRKSYITTKKGIDYLEKFNMIQNFTDSFGLG